MVVIDKITARAKPPYPCRVGGQISFRKHDKLSAFRDNLVKRLKRPTYCSLQVKKHRRLLANRNLDVHDTPL
jgi:hypothetical protein